MYKLSNVSEAGKIGAFGEQMLFWHSHKRVSFVPSDPEGREGAEATGVRSAVGPNGEELLGLGRLSAAHQRPNRPTGLEKRLFVAQANNIKYNRKNAKAKHNNIPYDKVSNKHYKRYI